MKTEEFDWVQKEILMMEHHLRIMDDRWEKVEKLLEANTQLVSTSISPKVVLERVVAAVGE